MDLLKKIPVQIFILTFLTLLTTEEQALAQVIAGPDQTICIGMSTQLSASNGSNYYWTSDPPDPSLTNPNSPNPSVTPTQTTMYVVESREVSITLIENGDFEDGNTAFYSDYTHSPTSVWNEGTYAITTNANNVHSNFFCDHDHTTGTGNMMVVNGAAVPGEVVWGQNVSSISPFTDYEFSVWVASMVSSNPAILQFRINGVLIDLPFQVNPDVCNWRQFFKIWNSGPATIADISIVNQNTNPSGNDFALDDISYAEATFYHDTTWIYVEPIPTSGFSSPVQSCINEQSTIVYTGNAPTSADYHWEFDGGTIISGSGQGPYLIQWTNTGIKNISLYVDGYGCSSDTTIQQTEVNDTPQISLSADATSIPFGTNTSLHATISSVPGPFTHQWKPVSEVVSPDQLDTDTELLNQTTTFYMISHDVSTGCTDSADIIITVTGGPLGILAYTASPDTICEGGSSTLELLISGGSGNYTVDWTSSPPGFIYTGSELTIDVDPTIDTWYYAEVDDGFSNFGPDSIQVIVQYAPVVTTDPDDLMLSEGSDAVFSCEGSFTNDYQWQESSDDGNSWINLSNNSTYSGCQSNQLSIHNVSPVMDQYLYRCELSGVCNPTGISLPALLEVVEDIMVISSAFGNDFCEDEEAEIPVNIENFQGITAFELTLQFDDQHLSYSNTSNIHDELFADIIISPTANSIHVQWSGSAPLSIAPSDIFQLNFNIIDTGYTVVVWDQQLSYFYDILMEKMLISFIDAELNILPLPEEADLLVASPELIYSDENRDVQLSASGGSGEIFTWYTDNCQSGNVIGTDEDIQISQPTETTIYYGSWSTTCGESACKTVTVIVEDRMVYIYAPNAFSPNGDMINDIFLIESPNTFSEFNLQIYNRWGGMINKSKSIDQGWDGNIGGNEAPVGVYTWRAEFIPEGQTESIVQTGTVALIK